MRHSVLQGNGETYSIITLRRKNVSVKLESVGNDVTDLTTVLGLVRIDDRGWDDHDVLGALLDLVWILLRPFDVF